MNKKIFKRASKKLDSINNPIEFFCLILPISIVGLVIGIVFFNANVVFPRYYNDNYNTSYFNKLLLKNYYVVDNVYTDNRLTKFNTRLVWLGCMGQSNRKECIESFLDIKGLLENKNH